VSLLNFTRRARPDQTHGPLGSPTSQRTLSGRRLVRQISICTDFVRGSGLVGSGRRQSPWVRVVEFDTDQTLSETWSQARTCLVGSGRVRFVQWNLETTRSDPTSDKVWPGPCQIPLHGYGLGRIRPDKVHGLVGNPRGPNGLCRRPGSENRVSDKVWSGPPSGIWTLPVNHLAAQERLNCHFRCPSFCAVSLPNSPLKCWFIDIKLFN